MKMLGILKGRAVIIPNQRDEARLLSKHYGKRDKQRVFKLHLAEAEYLQNKNRLEVANLTGKKVDLTEVIANNKTLKMERAVYAKLRLEGYILDLDAAQVAHNIHNSTSFAALRGIWSCQRDGAKYLIKILDENSSLTWQQFFKITALAAKNKMDLMLAIVDKDEDVTLERARKAELK